VRVYVHETDRTAGSPLRPDQTTEHNAAVTADHYGELPM
jgi:hypothetical protein